MATALSFDTCFLIDLERERRRGNAVNGDAHRFLRGQGSSILKISVTAFGEFAAGFDQFNHPSLQAVRQGFDLLATDREVALAYASIYRVLKSQHQLIGANDLWIAACAVRNGLPLVTRNTAEFSRVPNLLVVSY